MSQKTSARQSGLLLFELMLVAAISLAVIVWASNEWQHRARNLQAQSLAVWMLEAQEALKSLAQANATQIAAADSTAALIDSGIANWLEPSWQELKAQGFLASSWQPHGPLGQSLRFVIKRLQGCDQTSCLIRALIIANKPLAKKNGKPDEDLIAQWLMAVTGNGLVVWPHSQNTLSGAAKQIDLDDLSPAPVIGSVALASESFVGIRAESASNAEISDDEDSGNGIQGEDFLRVGDLRDPEFQGNANVQGYIRSASELIAQDGLLLESSWSYGQPCSSEWALGRSTGELALTQCRAGVWQKFLRPTGGAYMFNSKRGCTDMAGVPSANPVTATCSCPLDYLSVKISESGSLAGAEGLTTGFMCVAR